MKWLGMITATAVLLAFGGCTDLGPNHPVPLLPRAPGPEPTPVNPEPAPSIPTPKSANAEPASVKIDGQTTRRSLMEADAAFARTAEDQGVADAFYEFMTADALLLLPGEVPIKGNDAIKVHLTVNPPGIFVWRARDAQASEDANLGYTWGTYECRAVTPEDPRPKSRFGKYVNLWKKQADGNWRVQVHCASPSPAPTERR